MPLDEYRVLVPHSFVVCSVCGSIFAASDKKGPEGNGCSGPKREPKYSVDDVVEAKLDIGAGHEHIGERWVSVRITSVNEARFNGRPGSNKIKDFRKLLRERGESVYETKPHTRVPEKVYLHEYWYGIEILEECEGDKYYVDNHATESKIRPISS